MKTKEKSMNESSGVITDARELGTVKMLILGL